MRARPLRWAPPMELRPSRTSLGGHAHGRTSSVPAPNRRTIPVRRRARETVPARAPALVLREHGGREAPGVRGSDGRGARRRPPPRSRGSPQPAPSSLSAAAAGAPGRRRRRREPALDGVLAQALPPAVPLAEPATRRRAGRPPWPRLPGRPRGGHLARRRWPGRPGPQRGGPRDRGRERPRALGGAPPPRVCVRGCRAPRPDPGSAADLEAGEAATLDAVAEGGGGLGHGRLVVLDPGLLGQDALGVEFLEAPTEDPSPGRPRRLAARPSRMIAFSRSTASAEMPSPRSRLSGACGRRRCACRGP